MPCEGGVLPMTAAEQQPYWESIDSAWKPEQLGGAEAIVREVVGKNFLDVVEHVNAIAALAQDEGHHPNLYVYAYKHLRIELSTHAIGGLSVNDFILAAKIDALLEGSAQA